MVKLVIVESPTKAKTIGKFLGKGYKLESSYGHIRDLPKSRLGIDIENNFEPQYIVPMKAKKRANYLKKEAQKSDEVILATDEDREGEAIAWHLIQTLALDSRPQKAKSTRITRSKKSESGSFRLNSDGSSRFKRIVFHEITKSAIEDALKNPREIDLNLVNAQQARRILDRIVGYQLSPFLWKKIMSRLSAGRVQSVALRLIAERETEIRKFIPREYYTISAKLRKLEIPNSKLQITNEIEAILYKIDNKILERFDVKTKEQADEIVKKLKDCEFKVNKIETREIKKNPPPPFTTSTLQQTASQRLGLSAKQTMMFAQNLYENGLITYMRTDSLNLSKDSVFAAKKWIEDTLGAQYGTEAPRFFKTKSRMAQEAHEAIRPTKPEQIPDELQKIHPREKKLYELIWRRFISSQLPQARFNTMSIEIEARNPKSKIQNSYALKATGSTLKFDGFLKIWPTKSSEVELPSLKPQEILSLVKVIPDQHFTEPPPRYNEASLIKTLEELGIGRPSTYAPTLSVIQTRNYVIKNEQKRFQPTEIGDLVNKLLVEHFQEIVDVQFTAKIEEELDEIAEGKTEWRRVISEFYVPFSKNLEKKYIDVEKQKPIEEKTGELCGKCGKPMIIKYGRFGKFMACSGFPECKNAKPLPPKTIGIKCPKCEGDIIERKTKKRRFFYGCSNWPKCDFVSWKKPMMTCLKCGNIMVIKNKNTIICQNKDCEHEEKLSSAKN